MSVKRNLIISLLLCFCALPTVWGIEREYRYLRADGREGCVRLLSTSDSTSVLQYWRGDSLCSTWPLNCRVFQFHCADLTGNGIPDIALGVIHQSRYARYKSKRLWLLKLYDEELIRPLWLSSRLTNNLIDFELEPPLEPTDTLQRQTPATLRALIHTWEETLQGDTVEARYRHKGFGVVHL